MIEFKQIICPVDFSESSVRAFAHAAAIARWYDTDFRADPGARRARRAHSSGDSDAARPGARRDDPIPGPDVTKRNLSLKVKGPCCANMLFSGRSSGSQIAL